MKKFDVLVIGPVSLDHNIDCEGKERREIGGAVVASGFAAARSLYQAEPGGRSCGRNFFRFRC